MMHPSSSARHAPHRERVRRAVRGAVLVVAAVVCPLLARRASAQEQLAPDAAAALRRAIRDGDLPGARRGDYGRYRASLLALYPDSAARALWLVGGRPSSQGSAVLAELADAERRGLRPADYDARELARVVAALPALDASALLRTDAWLSLSLLRFLDHLHRGRADPAALGFHVPAERQRRDLASLAQGVSRAAAVRAALDAIEPPFAGFARLEALLARYRALAADSALVALPARPRVVHAGDAWPGASALRQLLVALGDLAPADTVLPVGQSADAYAGALVEGVRRFQRRHGLEPDGIIGPATLGQLRVPLARRVAQIELTMERWRWLPHAAPARLAVVNIPGFRLYLFDARGAGAPATTRIDVIVGRAYGRRTPVFAGTMRYVIFHPYWDVPPSIARREEVPAIRRDRGYAERLGMEIVRGGDEDAVVYPMTWTNLDRVAGGTLRLRQRPGPANALGWVKFVFPNEFNVYLHATPTVSLFSRVRRDFSHGCIRVSDPGALAEFVLRGEPGWDRGRIDGMMRDVEGPMLRVTLSRPLPVYILYATVVVSEGGTAYFYPDVYGHDAALARALGVPYAAPAIARGGEGGWPAAWEPGDAGACAGGG